MSFKKCEILKHKITGKFYIVMTKVTPNAYAMKQLDNIGGESKIILEKELESTGHSIPACKEGDVIKLLVPFPHKNLLIGDIGKVESLSPLGNDYTCSFPGKGDMLLYPWEIVPVGWSIDLNTSPPGCKHQFKEYRGFHLVHDAYCIHCKEVITIEQFNMLTPGFKVDTKQVS